MLIRFWRQTCFKANVFNLIDNGSDSYYWFKVLNICLVSQETDWDWLNPFKRPDMSLNRIDASCTGHAFKNEVGILDWISGSGVCCVFISWIKFFQVSFDHWGQTAVETYRFDFINYLWRWYLVFFVGFHHDLHLVSQKANLNFLKAFLSHFSSDASLDSLSTICTSHSLNCKLVSC